MNAQAKKFYKWCNAAKFHQKKALHLGSKVTKLRCSGIQSMLNHRLLQLLLFNTLQVRSALGAAQRRKLSFKNVSSVVVQLLHSIKYSMEVPFSNIATPGDHKANAARKVSWAMCPLLWWQ